MPNFIENKFLVILFFLVLIFGCKKAENKAQTIVDACVQAHGGGAYDKVNVSFDFRDKLYKITKNENDFIYERALKDSSGITKDVMDNRGLKRYINNKIIELPDSMTLKYKNSINSVAYFALLPQPLNDLAVRKSFLGLATIGGQKYDKIKVNFDQENGGKDHDDVFVYWINQETKYMDYFAYSYKVDGGGMRFREKINSQIVAGVRFQDYINYEPVTNKYTLENLDKAFVAGDLRELSRIENSNLKGN
jgi:hypothetical protein